MKYRRSGSTFFFRVRHGCGKAAKAFAWLFAVCGTIFTLISASGITIRFRYVMVTLAGCILVAFVYGVLKARIDHLPDSIVTSDAEDERYVLEFEPKDVCVDFNRETANYFGRDYLDETVVGTWWSKNQKGFIYLRNAQNEPCAALCIFGLNASFTDQFIKGRVSEQDIEADDILDLPASKKSASLYLAVIIIKSPHTQLGHRRAVAMVWGVIQYLKKIYGVKKTRTIYAVPVNKASENLLKRLGFQVVCRACVRKDRHDLYSFVMTPQSLATALERVGDHSSYCSLNLSDVNVV